MHRDVVKCWILAAQFINMQSTQTNTSTKQTRTSQQNRDHLKEYDTHIFLWKKWWICGNKNQNIPQIMISWHFMVMGHVENNKKKHLKQFLCLLGEVWPNQEKKSYYEHVPRILKQTKLVQKILKLSGCNISCVSWDVFRMCKKTTSLKVGDLISIFKPWCDQTCKPHLKVVFTDSSNFYSMNPTVFGAFCPAMRSNQSFCTSILVSMRQISNALAPPRSLCAPSMNSINLSQNM